MRHAILIPSILAFAVLLAPAPALALKKVPYSAIKIEVPAPFKGDAAFEAMRKAFAAAVDKKDVAGLAALVAPNFTWTAGSEPSEEFDGKLDALHNFKVAFGFREAGKSADGQTEIGPQWDLLSAFAADPSLAQEPGSPLVCGPSTAKLADRASFEKAMEKVDEDDDPAEWIYFVDEVTLTGTPTGGSSVGKFANTAMPLVALHPDPAAAKPPAQPQPASHVELLLPSGKTGWLTVDKARPLLIDRLCYAKSANGDWKIAGLSQSDY
jgi:hypothetical protein